MNPNDESATNKQSEQFVVFLLDDEEYAVPILSVAEVVPVYEIAPVPDAPAYILGLTNLRGKVLPVLDLEKKFQLQATVRPDRQHIMVAESAQKIQFGILVDQVKEVLKIPGDTIQPPPDILHAKINAEYLLGVIIPENKHPDTEASRMLLILDMEKILSDKTIEQLHAVVAKKSVPLQDAKQETI